MRNQRLDSYRHRPLSREIKTIIISDSDCNEGELGIGRELGRIGNQCSTFRKAGAAMIALLQLVVWQTPGLTHRSVAHCVSF